MKPLRSSVNIQSDPNALRRRLAEDGYLYLPQFLPRRQVEEIAAKLCDLMASRGWLDPGASASQAVARPGVFFAKNHAEYADVFSNAYVQQPFMELPHAPQLNDLLQGLYGERPFPLPNGLLPQFVFPRRPSSVDWTTAQHQEYYGPQGSPDFCVVWIPLLDCPLARGPLAVAEGTHRAGLYPVEFHLHEFHGVQAKGDFTEQWRASDMQAGDVLLFNCFTVHKALPNESGGIRLSASMKYQPESHPLCETSAANEATHLPSGLRWDAIYKTFEGFAYERYWRDYRLQIVPRDMRFTAGVFAMALRAAEEGDPLAVRHLRTLRGLVASYPRLAPQLARVVELVRAEAKRPLGPEDIDAMIEGVRGQSAVSA